MTESVIVTHKDGEEFCLILVIWRKDSGDRGFNAHLLIPNTSDLYVSFPFRTLATVIDMDTVDSSRRPDVFEATIQEYKRELSQVSNVLEDVSPNFRNKWKTRNYSEDLMGAFRLYDDAAFMGWFSTSKYDKQASACLRLVLSLADDHRLGRATHQETVIKEEREMLNQKLLPPPPRTHAW